MALAARAESPNTPLIREGYLAACQALGLPAGPEYRVGPERRADVHRVVRGSRDSGRGG
ncbi:hypothetical protein [Streptomyces sp. NBC_00233]|uniref:hypothetical protein n=1 Tax=Streptomyces sp. NBC_00233 TaxID=2975686 RepID=UPI002B1D4515|nr:hypothetical protein [Streptomyces sp. NBC_00233]